MGTVHRVTGQLCGLDRAVGDLGAGEGLGRQVGPDDAPGTNVSTGDGARGHMAAVHGVRRDLRARDCAVLELVGADGAAQLGEVGGLEAVQEVGVQVHVERVGGDGQGRTGARDTQAAVHLGAARHVEAHAGDDRSQADEAGHRVHVPVVADRIQAAQSGHARRGDAVAGEGLVPDPEGAGRLEAGRGSGCSAPATDSGAPTYTGAGAVALAAAEALAVGPAGTVRATGPSGSAAGLVREERGEGGRVQHAALELEHADVAEQQRALGQGEQQLVLTIAVDVEPLRGEGGVGPGQAAPVGDVLEAEAPEVAQQATRADEVEVGGAVSVHVTPERRARARVGVEPRDRGHVLELSLARVAQDARDVAGGEGEEVEEPVAVHVGPGQGRGRVRLR